MPGLQANRLARRKQDVVSTASQALQIMGVMMPDPIINVAPLSSVADGRSVLFCVTARSRATIVSAAASRAGQDLGPGLTPARMAGGYAWPDVVPDFHSHPHRGLETVTIPCEPGTSIIQLESLRQPPASAWATSISVAGAGVVPRKCFRCSTPESPKVRSSSSRSGSTCPTKDKLAAPTSTMFYRHGPPRLAASPCRGRRHQSP